MRHASGAYRLLVSTLADLSRTELDAELARRQPHHRIPPQAQEQARHARLAAGSTSNFADAAAVGDVAADDAAADVHPEPLHGHGPRVEARSIHIHSLADEIACIPCAGELLRADAVRGDDGVGGDEGGDGDITSEAVPRQHSVRVTYDQNVISPKNAFIVLQK